MNGSALHAVIGILLGALASSACREKAGAPAPLAPTPQEEFAKAYVEHLTHLEANLQVTIDEPLQLTATLHGRDHQLFLDNAWNEFSQFPDDKDAILERYARATLETVRHSDDDSIDPDRVVPIIKDAAYLEEVRASLAEGGSNGPIPMHFEVLNPQLHIFYAEDTQLNLRYLSLKNLQEAGLEPKDLRVRAVANLRNLLTEVELREGEAVHMISAGGTFEASLLLLDDLWENFDLPLVGAPVVALPSRELLLVTGAEDEAGLAALREVAAKAAAEASYRLTPDLFLRQDGSWILLD